MTFADRRPVLLVCPPSLFFKDDRQVPTLSHLYVAAALLGEGIPVEILDLPLVDRGVVDGDPAYLRAVEERLESGPDYQAMGVTALSPQMREVLEIGRRAKAVRPEMRTILGGAHPTLDHRCDAGCRPKSGTPDTPFDCVVVGDGEEAVFAALDPSVEGRYVHANRLAHKMATVSATDRPLLTDLDAIVPARQLTQIDRFTMTLKDRDGRSIPATTIMTQRGCPFECTFCGGRDTPVYRLRRTRSPEAVIAELRQIKETYGYSGIFVYDDEVNLPPWPVFFELMDRLAAEGLVLRGFIKAELFTEEVAAAMARAGFVEVATGVESGSAQILKNIRKKTTPGDNSRAAAIARKHGIRFKAFLSVGHPGETRETVRETHDWALEEIGRHGAGSIYATVSLIAPYPGTPIFDRPESLGHLGFSLTRPQVEIDYTRERTFELADGESYNCLIRTDLRWTGSVYEKKPDGLTPPELIECRAELEGAIRQAQGGPGGGQYDKSMGQE